MIARRVLINALMVMPVASAAMAQSRRPRIIILHSGFPYLAPTHLIVDHLKDLGYENKRNAVIEIVGAEGDTARLGELVAALVADPPDVTVAVTSGAAVALKASGLPSPIVFLVVADPIGLGLIESFSRPGGNFTGMANPDPTVVGKRIELLNEALPSLRRVAVLWSRSLPEARPGLEAVHLAAVARGLSVVEQEYDVKNMDAAFAAAKSAGAEAVVFLPSNAAFRQRREIAGLALAYGLPSIHSFSVEVADGGLMSYGVDLSEFYRRTAGLVDRILKGARPAELPVEHPTTFTFAVNLKVAAAFGITLPPSILLRANEVIE